MRFRKEDPPGVKEKRKMKQENLGYVRKVCTLVSQGPMVIGCVFHVINEDNTGEFDPYGIERMKNALQMMRCKKFAEVIETEINQMHTYKLLNKESEPQV